MSLMKRGNLGQGLLTLAVFSVLLFAVLLRRPTVVDGTEIGYRLAPGVPKEVEQIVRGRVAALGLDAEVTLDKDLLLIRIPNAKPEDVADVKRLIRRKGSLEFRATADRETQEAYKKSGVVPEGFEVVGLDRQDPTYEAWTPKMLIRTSCALEGGRVIHAEPQKEVRPGDPGWSVAFELDAKGATKFDETAAVLYARRPPGMIAILLDGKLHSAPAVMTTAFGGSGRITGVGGEREAKDLAIILTTGALPVPLGQEPEFERPFRKEK
jgi:preprotein translocase subunit SecD